MSDAPTTARPPAEGGSRRLILDHAARLLRGGGYHQTTLREIAEAVGIRKASLYYHFGSKEEIVEEVAATAGERQEREIPTADIGAKVMERLRELDQVAYVRFASVYRQFSDVQEFLDELRNLIGPAGSRGREGVAR